MAGRPGRRPRMTRRVASKGVALRRPRFVRRRRYPARFANSKYTYNLNRRVSRIMNKMSETKLLQTQPFNESTPTAIQTAAIAYYWSGVMQSIPSGWDTSLHNLAGIVTTQGLGGFNRIGDYVYYKKTHLVSPLLLLFKQQLLHITGQVLCSQFHQDGIHLYIISRV